MDTRNLENQDFDSESFSPSTLRQEMHQLVDYAEYVHDYAAELLGKPLPEEMRYSVEAILESAKEIGKLYHEALEYELAENLEQRAGDIFEEMDMFNEILATFCDDFEDYFPYITDKPRLRSFIIPDIESYDDFSEKVVIHTYGSSLLN